MIRPSGPDSLLVIVPAFNEEGAIGDVVRSVRQHVPGAPVLVIDDCSRDSTIALARRAGADVLALPHHLGLGGCVQAGYKLAHELGFEYVIRIDGDGQHDARDIPRIFERLKSSGCEMVIGSRYVNGNGDTTSFLRGLGIRFFRAVLRPILGKAVHDPTSGFVGVNRAALAVFTRSFPLEYPEIETLVVLQRKRFRFEEVPCKMRPRTTGRSSITAAKSLYYIAHVLLGVFVNVLKYDRRIYHRGTTASGAATPASGAAAPASGAATPASGAAAPASGAAAPAPGAAAPAPGAAAPESRAAPKSVPAPKSGPAPKSVTGG